jgi:hypothetical protein
MLVNKIGQGRKRDGRHAHGAQSIGHSAASSYASVRRDRHRERRIRSRHIGQCQYRHRQGWTRPTTTVSISPIRFLGGEGEEENDHAVHNIPLSIPPPPSFCYYRSPSSSSSSSSSHDDAWREDPCGAVSALRLPPPPDDWGARGYDNDDAAVGASTSDHRRCSIVHPREASRDVAD